MDTVPRTPPNQPCGSTAAPAPATVPAWKRILDVSLTLGALPLLEPLSAAIAVAIKCFSRGPVLFRQERIGLNGKQFIFLRTYPAVSILFSFVNSI